MPSLDKSYYILFTQSCREITERRGIQRISGTGMCGRYAIFSPPAELRRLFGVERVPNFEPNWNVAPTQRVPIVRETEDGREATLVQWGLVPWWSRKRKHAPVVFNARAETLTTDAMYREAFAHRRCLVVADGYYEWERIGSGARRPWYICRADREPFAFAGLWDIWTDSKTSETFESCVIITTRANRLVGEVRNRMPAILGTEQYDEWLAVGLQELIYTPCPEEWLNKHQVDDQVNDIRNNESSLLEALSAE